MWQRYDNKNNGQVAGWLEKQGGDFLITRANYLVWALSKRANAHYNPYELFVRTLECVCLSLFLFLSCSNRTFFCVMLYRNINFDLNTVSAIREHYVGAGAAAGGLFVCGIVYEMAA